jgi:hypothetical protein
MFFDLSIMPETTFDIHPRSLPLPEDPVVILIRHSLSLLILPQLTPTMVSHLQYYIAAKLEQGENANNALRCPSRPGARYGHTDDL